MTRIVRRVDAWDEPFGWREARILTSSPRSVPDHSPHFGCPCLICVKTRRDIERYGFNGSGGIDYPRARPTLPWEDAA